MDLNDPLVVLAHYEAIEAEADAAAAWKIRCQTTAQVATDDIDQACATSEAAARRHSQAIQTLRRTYPQINRVWGDGNSTAAQRQAVLATVRLEVLPAAPPEPPAAPDAGPWQLTLF